MSIFEQSAGRQNPEVKPFAALAELDRRVKSAQMQQAHIGEQAMQQAQGLAQQPPVAQQVLSQSAGIAGISPPQNFFGGGIVSFADGGPIWEESEEPFDLEESVRKKLEAAKYVGGIAKDYGRIPGLVMQKLYDMWNGQSGASGSWDSPRESVPFGPENETPKEQPEVTPVSTKAPSTSTRTGPRGFVPTKMQRLKLERPAFEEIGSMTADEIEAAGKERAAKGMEAYDTQLKDNKDYEEGLMTRAKAPRSSTENFLRAMAASKDLGRRRLGSSLAGVASNMYGEEDKDQARRDQLMATAMQARQLRVQARVAFEQGEKAKGEALSQKALEMENAVVAERNRQATTEANTANAETSLNENIRQFEENKSIQREQMANAIRAAQIAAASRSSNSNMAEQRLIRQAVESAQKQAEKTVGASPEYMAAFYRGDKAKAQQMMNQAAFRIFRQQMPDVPLDEAKQMFDSVGTLGATPGAGAVDYSAFKVTEKK
jgi:hypothetical protein